MGNFYVKKDFLVGLGTDVVATSNSDIPNLGQVEGLVAGVLAPLEAARMESDVNVDIATAGLAVVDGVQTVAGDRILLTAQTDPIDNGVYIVVDGGTWTRALDVAVGVVLEPGKKIFIEEGTDHQYHEQKLAASADVTVGTDAQTWVHAYTYNQEASATSYDNTGRTYTTDVDVQAVLTQVDVELVAQDGRLDVNESDITAVEGRSTTLETEMDSAESRLTTNEGAITAVEGRATTLETEMDAAEGRLTTNEAALVTNADAIAANVTAIANIDVTGDIQTFYDGQKFTQTGTTLTAGTWTNIVHSLNETYPSGIEVYDNGGNRFTNSFNIEVIDVNTIRIENEYPVDLTTMVVVVRA